MAPGPVHLAHHRRRCRVEADIRSSLPQLRRVVTLDKGVLAPLTDDDLAALNADERAELEAEAPASGGAVRLS